MGILDADVEMDGSSISGKQKNKSDVKAISKNSAGTLLEKRQKMKKKGEKPPVLLEKRNQMKTLKTLKNQIWMKVVKEMAERKNLIPIHQELLTKIVGRTCLPQQKKQFLTFVGSCLKINREKYEKSIEELFMMLKKNLKKSVQGAGLRQKAEVAAKVKKEELAIKSGKKVVDKSNLTKGQRKRQRRKERQMLARARDGILQSPKIKKEKVGPKSKGLKKPTKSKLSSKKVSVKKVKKPQKRVMKKGAKNSTNRENKKEVKIEADS